MFDFIDVIKDFIFLMGFVFADFAALNKDCVDNAKWPEGARSEGVISILRLDGQVGCLLDDITIRRL